MSATTTSTRPGPLTGTENIRVTDHAKAQMAAKGLTVEQVFSALTRPEKITDVMRYPDQYRYCGAGVAVVVEARGNARTVITAYLDGVCTVLRPDQMDDPAALASTRALRPAAA